MPELDYALLCDYVRMEDSGVAHVIAAGIDTIALAQVPAWSTSGCSFG